MGDEKLDGASSREQQIPPLRCGMTNKGRATTKAKTNAGVLPLRQAQGQNDNFLFRSFMLRGEIVRRA